MKIALKHIDGCFDDFAFGDTCEFELMEPSKETYTHEQAREYVKDKPLRLMTKREIHLLLAAGILKRGDVSFWSSSAVSGVASHLAWRFIGVIGVADSHRINAYAIRCVAPCGEKTND